MSIEIPDRLTFKQKEVVKITKLDAKVLDYWEKEFGGMNPVINQTGEKFYSKKDVQRLVRIKQLLVDEQKSKDDVKRLLTQDTGFEQVIQQKVSNQDMSPDVLHDLKNGLQEILTILDKNDKS